MGIVGMVQRAGMSVGRDRVRGAGERVLGLSLCHRDAVLNAVPLRRNNLDPLCETAAAAVLLAPIFLAGQCRGVRGGAVRFTFITFLILMFTIFTFTM